METGSPPPGGGLSVGGPPADGAGPDPRQPAAGVLRDLRTTPTGLSEREAQRRLVRFGPNELRRTTRSTWVRHLVAQFVHPLALLLWAAAGLALATDSSVLAWAIVLVITLNALFAFVQEQQAERAVEALQEFLASQATVLRDGERRPIDPRRLVPGDLVLLAEGERIPADARLLEGSLEVDLSALTGESRSALRSADLTDVDVPFLEASDLVFSGTTCLGGDARAVVFATGMQTELGRIAALSARVRTEESPLEAQVRRAAMMIAGVAVALGLVFLPLGLVGADLSLQDSASFAIGILVANVPEGLLPTITLALAVGVRVLAGRGAIVKRLSAVETLGSTTVICTDKTGTLTENRMRVTRILTLDGDWEPGRTPSDEDDGATVRAVLDTVVACNNAIVDPGAGNESGDPTEIALLHAAADARQDTGAVTRDDRRRLQYHFDPRLKMMSTVDEGPDGLVLHTKGAPEEVVARCTRTVSDGREAPMTPEVEARILADIDRLATGGLRLLAVARRRLPAVPVDHQSRAAVEADLSFLGLVALHDPPRPEVADAIARCHDAGIRVIVLTGDHRNTAAAVARQVGIGDGSRVIGGDELEAMTENQLDALLATGEELVFARVSPEAKLRIADALRALNEVVAMTGGDGVNDAPALHRADIGVAMGRVGTDVAREAATVILTDDNFATIVAAVEEGRRVYANIRKFVFYIFVHLTPEAAPFLLFALAGGAVPLPLTVLQILAIDLGTEILPALALGREPAEPQIMDDPPRPRSENVIQVRMLVRAWIVLGFVSAVLVLGAFFFVMVDGGWHWGDPVGAGTALHDTYLQATTMTFLGIVACQVGTAFAARTDRSSLWSIGLFSNRLLLAGIAVELAFALGVTYAPPLQDLFDTAALPPAMLLVLVPFPFIVLAVDEAHRRLVRARRSSIS